jgi:hypothetical protein
MSAASNQPAMSHFAEFEFGNFAGRKFVFMVRKKSSEQPEAQQAEHNQQRDKRDGLFFLCGEFEEHGRIGVGACDSNIPLAQVEGKMRFSLLVFQIQSGTGAPRSTTLDAIAMFYACPLYSIT